MGHQFDSTGPFVRVTFSGDVTPEDIIAVGQKAGVFDHGSTVVLDRLIDVTGISGGSKVGYREIADFTAHRRNVTFPNSYKCAVVASSDLQRGFARMVQTLIEHPQIVFEIFPEVKAAEAWLQTSTPNPDAS